MDPERLKCSLLECLAGFSFCEFEVYHDDIMILDLKHIASAIQSRSRTVLPSEGRPKAGVAVYLYGPGPDYQILYTVRTHLVEHHKGEISFPGGAMDLADEGIVDTALREGFEEIGVSADDVTVLGLLDDIVTRTNFAVTPIVARIESHAYHFALAEREVDELLAVPLSHLIDPVNVLLGEAGPDGLAPPPAYKFRGHVIFGATAIMTRRFLDMLQGVL